MRSEERILSLVKEERIEEAYEMIVEELDYTNFNESCLLFEELIEYSDKFYYDDKALLAHKMLSLIINFLSVRVATPTLYKALTKEAKLYLREGNSNKAKELEEKASQVLEKLAK